MQKVHVDNKPSEGMTLQSGLSVLFACVCVCVCACLCVSVCVPVHL